MPASLMFYLSGLSPPRLIPQCLFYYKPLRPIVPHCRVSTFTSADTIAFSCQCVAVLSARIPISTPCTVMFVWSSTLYYIICSIHSIWQSATSLDFIRFQSIVYLFCCSCTLVSDTPLFFPNNKYACIHLSYCSVHSMQTPTIQTLISIYISALWCYFSYINQYCSTFPATLTSFSTDQG